jgi:methionyl-tRNA synthetase
LNLEGNKISTSKNWAIWLHEYLEDFPNMQDSLRYTLTVNAPESKDNDFTWKDFQLRNNSELVAIFGNFVNRTLVLTHKYYEGVVPNQVEEKSEHYNILKEIYKYPEIISKSLDDFKFRDSVNALIDLARLGNKFLADTEPWKLIKVEDQKTKVEEIMFISIQICGMLAILSEPFMPFASEKLKSILNLKTSKWTELNISSNIIDSKKLINKPELIFRKIEDEEIERELKKLNNNN